MATQEALDALKETQKALKEIAVHLKPFLKRLRRGDGEQEDSADHHHHDARPASSSRRRTSNDKNGKHFLAQAQAAVALSLGTLRYMGARLRGLDQGRTSDDPLRRELNQMRAVLVEIEKLGKKRQREQDEKKQAESKAKGSTKKETRARSTEAQAEKQQASRKRKTPETSPNKKRRKR